MKYKSDYPEDDHDEADPLESRQFYELMQQYRHSIWAISEFEAVKTWLRESLGSNSSLPKDSLDKNTDRSEHWMQGGTGITNFAEKDLPRYLEAIDKYGDTSLFVGHPIGNFGLSKFALRQKGSTSKDLSRFWRIFESIK